MVVVTFCPPLKLICTCTHHSSSFPQGKAQGPPIPANLRRALSSLTRSEAASPQISNPFHLTAFAPLAFQQTQGPLHLTKRKCAPGPSFPFLLFRANFLKECVCPLSRRLLTQTPSPLLRSPTTSLMANWVLVWPDSSLVLSPYILSLPGCLRRGLLVGLLFLWLLLPSSWGPHAFSSARLLGAPYICFLLYCPEKAQPPLLG